MTRAESAETTAHQCCCHGHGTPVEDDVPLMPSEPCDGQQCPDVGVSVLKGTWSQLLDPQYALSLPIGLVQFEELSKGKSC